MANSYLRDHFIGVGAKRLTAVDAEPSQSHQHEVGTTQEMRRLFLGENNQRFRTFYVWLDDDENAIVAEGEANHYDVRENQPHRSPEWRLYYRGNSVTETMSQGDSLFLAKARDDSLYLVVAPQDSTSERQLSWLFGLSPSGQKFVSREIDEDGGELGFAARFILDELGIETELPESEELDNIIDQFEGSFPNTEKFSQTARDSLPELDSRDDPDIMLVRWLDREEALFRRLERRLVSERLHVGFIHGEEINVDEFLRFSLSVHNRRKSRMGHSLEHHLAAVFDAHELEYVRQAVTERKSKPDFLFPSLEVYRDAPRSGDPRLTMLGAKSTCKDRWRQVLPEAEKIPQKHLFTLEPGISEDQTGQMQSFLLQLVVPEPVRESYTPSQQDWLWNLADFIGHVKSLSKEGDGAPEVGMLH